MRESNHKLLDSLFPFSYALLMSDTLQRLTQPDWCNEPQPHNWSNACMRLPDHTGPHAVRKSYRPDEAFQWGENWLVLSVRSARFDDLWDTDVPYDRMLAVDWFE